MAGTRHIPFCEPLPRVQVMLRRQGFGSAPALAHEFIIRFGCRGFGAANLSLLLLLHGSCSPVPPDLKACSGIWCSGSRRGAAALLLVPLKPKPCQVRSCPPALLQHTDPLATPARGLLMEMSLLGANQEQELGGDSQGCECRKPAPK